MIEVSLGALEKGNICLAVSDNGTTFKVKFEMAEG